MQVQNPAYRPTALLFLPTPIIYMSEEKKPSLIERITEWVTTSIRFITYDIWRITDDDVTGLRRIYIYLAKTLILAIRGFSRQDLQTRASALTYSTLLSVVPMLAVVVGIASGFGVQDIIQRSLSDYFPAQAHQISRAIDFALNYLSMTRGGVLSRMCHSGNFIVNGKTGQRV